MYARGNYASTDGNAVVRSVRAAGPYTYSNWIIRATRRVDSKSFDGSVSPKQASIAPTAPFSTHPLFSPREFPLYSTIVRPALSELMEILHEKLVNAVVLHTYRDGCRMTSYDFVMLLYEAHALMYYCESHDSITQFSMKRHSIIIRMQIRIAQTYLFNKVNLSLRKIKRKYCTKKFKPVTRVASDNIADVENIMSSLAITVTPLQRERWANKLNKCRKDLPSYLPVSLRELFFSPCRSPSPQRSPAYLSATVVYLIKGTRETDNSRLTNRSRRRRSRFSVRSFLRSVTLSRRKERGGNGNAERKGVLKCRRRWTIDRGVTRHGVAVGYGAPL